MWLRLAAENGNINAKLGFVSFGAEAAAIEEKSIDWLVKYKEDSMRFLNQAANEGNVDALNQIALIYFDGKLVPRNLTMAYAYMSAVNQTGLVKSSGRLMEMWAKDMSQDDLDKAKQLAVGHQRIMDTHNVVHY